MKTLVIHHLELTWQNGYANVGTTFDELARKTIAHIKRAKYDRVILTQFENWQAQDEHHESGIAELIDEWHDYGYAWELDNDVEDIHDENGFIYEHGNKYVDGGNHSRYVLIDTWIEKLKGHNVSICGAFDGECIEDLEIALRACDIKFKRIENLIV